MRAFEFKHYKTADRKLARFNGRFNNKLYNKCRYDAKFQFLLNGE